MRPGAGRVPGGVRGTAQGGGVQARTGRKDEAAMSIMNKISCLDIECAMADYFNPRANLIVPNVSWGLWKIGHECDILVVTPSNYCYEIEIKTSRSDLIADLKKSHAHKSEYIKKLYFAIPDYLIDSIEFIPQRAGILLVSAFNGHEHVKCQRLAEINDETLKISADDRYLIARLGTMRIWSMKDIIRRRKGGE
jgi:hypothetical protein